MSRSNSASAAARTSPGTERNGAERNGAWVVGRAGGRAADGKRNCNPLLIIPKACHRTAVSREAKEGKGGGGGGGGGGEGDLSFYVRVKDSLFFFLAYDILQYFCPRNHRPPSGSAVNKREERREGQEVRVL